MKLAKKFDNYILERENIILIIILVIGILIGLVSNAFILPILNIYNYNTYGIFFDNILIGTFSLFIIGISCALTITLTAIIFVLIIFSLFIIDNIKYSRHKHIKYILNKVFNVIKLIPFDRIYFVFIFILIVIMSLFILGGLTKLLF